MVTSSDLVYVTNVPAFKYKFIYPRPFEFYDTHHNVTFVSGNDRITITVSGVPDGVSPLATRAIMKKGTISRMHIYSTVPITEEKYMKAVDLQYGKIPYPVLSCSLELRLKHKNIPQVNFFTSSTMPPSAVSQFTEYRYLMLRDIPSNIVYDSKSGSVFRLTLPERPFLVIMMPENFIQTAQRQGYFVFENDLIIHVFSRYTLSSKTHRLERKVHVTDLSMINSDRIKTLVNSLFARLGLHKVSFNIVQYNNIFAYDKYITMVVGNIANVIYPR